MAVNVLNAASSLLECFCHGAVVKSLALSPRESIKQASSAEISQESLLIAGERMERIDQMGTAYEAWVTAREKVAKELPPLILENPNDDLIRALIAQEVVAHRHFIAARDQKNGA
ncbi:hypothetical protein PSP6_160085 [Paraburkholderia tropica]|uniref:hypothetical protein n=1 Tax=Paraburkholderia tropica TaxID=92647 RepID=UPI001CAC988D|nr:hypothetical protein [Paraburkholderia tropica]CAG9195674.1 hypothetical protein PSP6_160085 [Paraburkholderia tropica]